MAHETHTFEQTLRDALAPWSIPITDGQMLQLCAHYEAMIEANRVMNLTRITDPIEAAIKHYADSLAALLWIRESRLTVSTVLDVGTGAGFPAVPLAVMRPDCQVMAIDGTQKKTDFLQTTVQSIELKNLAVEQAHSVHWRSGRRFDLVVARAVGSLAGCLPALVPHARRGGLVLVYKTPTALDEMDEVEPMLHGLRLKALEPFPYQLMLNNEHLERLLVTYQRIK